MALLIGAAIGGVTLGLIYGFLGFSIVLLYKATGVANFAQGNIATFATFLVYFVIKGTGLNIYAAIAIGVPMALALGAALYFLTIRFNDDAGPMNLTVRTLALYLLLGSVMTSSFGAGQPFPFPSALPSGSFELQTYVRLPEATLVILIAALLLGGASWLFFKRSTMGLFMRAMAEDPEVAELLGVRSRAVTALAWAIAGTVSLFVGVFIAPTALLSSNMTDLFLYAFTGVVVGGLTSLPGAFVGGIVVGLVQDVTAVYLGGDESVLAVFILLIAVLLYRPHGIFGESVAERL